MGLAGLLAHFQEMLHPMEKFHSIDEIEKYPFPDFNEDYRWEGVHRQVEKIIADDLIAIAFMQMTIFEVSWYLRGMDTFMLDMITKRTGSKLEDWESQILNQNLTDLKLNYVEELKVDKKSANNTEPDETSDDETTTTEDKAGETKE